ncbi:MAG: S46 family peptidase, partial [Acidobacteriota bacterium]
SRSIAPFVLTATLLAADPAGAEEGMFLLDRLPAPALKRAGLKVDPTELLRLSRAVVQVASGGTGSFVSPRGLLVTNHHVAYRCLTVLGSRKKHLGLLERGHLARSLAEELPCPGYDLLGVDSMREVTGEVLAAARPGMSWAARFEALRLRQEDLVAACEREGKHICQVAALDGGASYLLSVYRRIRDVRLVYAPPDALGKFGGDVDNWMYPRHTADFTFLRAYVDTKGTDAPHAAANVPLATPLHLRITDDGLTEGAPLEVIGFPARTARHVTSHAARFYLDEQVPRTLEVFRALIQAVTAERTRSADIKRKYASYEAGLQNGLKYYEMSRQGLERWRTLARKLEEEQALTARLAADPKAAAAMRRLLDEIGAVYRRYRAYYPRQLATRWIAGSCPTQRLLHDLARWTREKAKPDRLRKEERYKEKNSYRIAETAERLDREIDRATEGALLLAALRLGMALPAAQRPRSTAALLRRGERELARLEREARRAGKTLAASYRERVGRELPADKLQRAVELMLAGTRLLARDETTAELTRASVLRARVFGGGRAAAAKLGDPLLDYALELEAEITALREGPYREVEQRLETVLHREWVQTVKRPTYPDANFTVRLSYGQARSYRASATGKAHRYLTTLAELLAKDQGKPPFLVPPRLRAAFPARQKSPYLDRRLGDVPVNFTATLDTTGGNSGSPVLDGRGRLVGLLFDGTPESILSDWQFLREEQRAICLDIRFALYLAAVDGATRLLKEIQVE